MTFGEAISTCFNKYTNFNGRASRSEFWWFMLLEVLVLGITSLFSMTLYGIAALVFILPVLSVGSRRLHDIGRSGWWQLLSLTVIGSLVLLYWFVQPTEEGSNLHDAPVAA
jgi:uncharacterized membrane protein YhaH (DUF805 family)